MMTLLGRRRVPVLMQDSPAQCGPTCVRAIAAYFGRHLDANFATLHNSGSVRGYDLKGIISLSRSVGLSARALRADTPDLDQIACPAIVHWNFDHFVVIERINRRRVEIMDPALGRRSITITEFGKCFTGVVLELQPGGDFTRRDQRRRLRLASLFEGLPGLPASILQLLAVSVSVQALTLTMPFFTQLVIDDVITSHDLQLLNLLAMSFLALGLTQVAMGLLRGWYSMRFGSRIQLLVSARVFNHLLRLPLRFFAQRHLGDLMSRFDSLQTIQQLLTRTAVEAVMDALMVLLALALMLMYSPELSAIVVAVITCHALLCAGLHPVLRQRTRAALAHQARCQTGFLESLRCLQTLKINALESRYEATWLNRLGSAINASLELGVAGLWQQTAKQGLAVAEKIAVVWLGARSVLDGRLSLGMLVAFLAYRQYLLDRSFSLIQHGVEFGTSAVHRDRLADITQTGPEPEPAQRIADDVGTFRFLAAEGLWFRYSAADPWIVRDLTLRLDAGECALITGASGCGKSTLIRILLGLIEPTRGRIMLDGHDLLNARSRFRGLASAVMQDDTLLDGTIADNISALDPSPDHKRIAHCAELASIHETICRLPMGYLSRIGDFGNTLSGGQRQRLLLARALYRRPQILFLDEAFNQLDRGNATACVKAIRNLGITHISASHRDDGMTDAGLIIRLGER
jgi:ATP-binding cassette subfamily B protein RaxB